MRQQYYRSCDDCCAANTRKGFRRRRGATILLMCLIIPVALAVASFCINVVFLELTRTELQITTDVATRAAGRVLAVTGNRAKAITAAERLLELNPTANKLLTLAEVDIRFRVSIRHSEQERYRFGTGRRVNAVHIDSNGSFEVPMVFPTLGVPVPFRPFKSAISKQTEIDVALVLDRSGSMAFADYEQSSTHVPPAAAPVGWKFGDAVPGDSRWLDTVDAVDGLMDLLELSSHDERVALSTYSDRARFDVRLTNRYEEIRSRLTDYCAKFDGGGTNIAHGILSGARALSDRKNARAWASRVMIVLSDGIHNASTSPLHAAKQASEGNITIFTITFSKEADQQLMRRIAEESGGKHFHAANSNQLVEAFEDIARGLPTLITF